MTPEEQKKILEEQKKLAIELTSQFKQQAQFQQNVSESVEGYVSGVKKLKIIQKEVLKNKQLEKKLVEEIAELEKANNVAGKIAADIKLKILKEQNQQIIIQGKALSSALASVNKTSLMGAKALGESLKAFSNIPNMIQNSFNKVKGWGLFEMEKSMKKSALSIGVLEGQSKQFESTIKSASLQTNMIGVGIKELSEMQATFSDELGRGVLLSKEALINMADMAVATGLGAEGVAKFAVDIDRVGGSVEETSNYMQDALDKSHKMGVTASKTVKLVQNNMKMLNKYKFKDGIKGLNDMAVLVAKLGVDMNVASGFADKLWNVEGAVDMAAQLQVMGGQWANMVDPFQLMFKARNDMKGLTEDIAKAASTGADFNKVTGEFELATAEMHKLKIIAEQTGMEYDDLVTMGKNAAKFSKIKGQISFGMNDEEKEFLSAYGKLDKQGKAYIEVNGEKKFLSQMDSTGRQLIKTQIAEKQKMADRAKESITFDEKVTFLINELKVIALPLVQVMTDRLVPAMDNFVKKFIADGWADKISNWAEKLGGWISTVGEWILEFPRFSIAMLGLAKALPTLLKVGEFLTDSIRWFKNGQTLAAGFNSAANAGGSAVDDITGGTGKGGKGGMFKRPSARVMKGAGVAGLAGMGLGMANDAEMFGDEGSTGHKMAGVGASALEWGATGAIVGSMVPVIGTAVGAAIGGIGGAIKGAFDEGIFGEGVNDGFFSGGGLMGAGIGGALGGPLGALLGTFLGTRKTPERGVIQNGKITPINTQDDLLALKPGGPASKAMGGGGGSAKVEFSTLRVEGRIELYSQGAPGVTVDILKNEGIQREIARIVASQMQKTPNYGKNIG